MNSLNGVPTTIRETYTYHVARCYGDEEIEDSIRGCVLAFESDGWRVDAINSENHTCYTADGASLVALAYADATILFSRVFKAWTDDDF